MEKKNVWKWLILVGLTAWSLAIVYPIGEKVKLGLDLQGGTRFVLQVDTSELDADAARDAQSRALEVIRNRVDAMGVSEPVIYTEPGNRIIVEIPGLKTEDRERAIKNIQSAAFLEFRMVHADNTRLTEEFMNKGVAPEGYRIVTVDEPRQGGGSEPVKYLKRDKSKDAPGTEESDVRKRLASFKAPAGHELMLQRARHHEQDLFLPNFVSKRREITGESIANASIDYDMVQRPVVSMRFDSAGARRFGNLTGDYAPGGAKNPGNTRRQLAIILDGTLYSAPTIREAIFGGQAQIEGSFSIKEAQDLSLVLRAGALPAPVKLLEERTVDPTLGKDSIESGKRATLLGGAAVMLFMLAYYMLAGVVSNVALLMNVLLLPVGLIVTGGFFSTLANSGMAAGGVELPTLTLPGIAGIALTIGMAVDANVLIYERMREEQKAGKRFKAVVEAGYLKAFSAIFDSNLTTLISAVILFWVGTGPVRGYAVTLSAGVLVSMYTALVITRMVFDLLTKTNIQQLKMLEIVRETKIDFLKISKFFIALSVIVILIVSATFIGKGKANFGVDFLGGASITLQFNEKVEMDQVRATLDAAGVPNAAIQYQKAAVVGTEGAVAEYLEIKTEFENGKQAADVLVSTYADQGFRVLKEDSVGPQIGRELQGKALWAVSLALLAIIAYVSFRFEFPFAAGAVVALFHDVIVAVGVFCLLGGQLSVSMLAAVLTIIGYSVNDTIVIFDRVRENMKLYPNKGFAEVANLSLNQTLGRTLLTSFATMLSVVALLVFGGGAIYDFALVLFIGMISGVYSTIYVATPVVMFWHRSKKTATA
jgi:SecD/SecF fusion protein